MKTFPICLLQAQTFPDVQLYIPISKFQFADMIYNYVLAYLVFQYIFVVRCHKRNDKNLPSFSTMIDSAS